MFLYGVQEESKPKPAGRTITAKMRIFAKMFLIKRFTP